MKKFKIIIILFCLLYFVNIQAKQVSYGFKYGLNTSTFAGKDAGNNYDYNFGEHNYGFGFSITVPLANYYHLQTEILLTAKGAIFDDEYHSYYLHYYYIEIPIIFKYGNSILSRKGTSKKGPYIYFGQSTNILVEATWESGLYDSGNIEDVTQIDLELLAGFEIKIIRNFFIDMRYEFGLSPVYDYEIDLYHRSFTVYFVGYF